MGISAGTTPYGIDTDASTGMVWYTRLFGDKIGKIHPETMKVTEYDSPRQRSAPNALRQAWHVVVDGLFGGMIAKINTETMETKCMPFQNMLKVTDLRLMRLACIRILRTFG